MILTKEIEVIPNGKNIQYYKDKGYDFKWREPLTVKVDDLPPGSNVEIEVLCDYCKKNKMKVKYYAYNRTFLETGSYSCRKCFPQKSRDTCRIRYGVDRFSQTDEYRKKVEKTSMEKYNVLYPSQSDIVKQKKIDVCQERYGVDNPLCDPKVREKMRSTNLEKYGFEYAAKSEAIKERMKKTNQQRYGVNWTQQSSEIRTKTNETLCKNGNVRTSSQQLYIHNLYGGKLNYPIKYYSVDICFTEEKLIIEYDGGFHMGRVILGELTQEEFDIKEIARSKTLKREGYKTMRIISQKDFLPSDEILLQMLSQARQYFSDYPNYSWISYNIDTSTVHNAEHKEGIFFDFGELRKIHSTEEPVAV